MTTPATRVGVRELRGKLSEYLRKAESGERFVVVSRGKPIVEFHGIAAPAESFRKPGALRGRIWIADDFDTLPDEMIEAVERDLPQ